ncbi:MAG: glucans biosynthesis protein G [Planctomycetota bacterium]|nr:MAG: glucans biosynthesis protein G [Planctomycetota bacterium]
MPVMLCTLFASLLLASAQSFDDDLGEGEAAAPASPPAFSADFVDARARELAQQPARELEATLPDPLPGLDYDGFRRIAFRPEHRLWAEQPGRFRADLLHLGALYRIPVNVHVVDAGLSTALPYTPEWFEFRDELPRPSEAVPGYSGFRLRHPLNRPDSDDEFLVFQGASYFRGVGRDQAYGTSARGLALRTADPRGEEFPAFTEFWLERPEPDATEVRFHALLESESVVGAYHFVARPGDATVVSVEATLFARAELDALGLAPLTSMFFFDTANRDAFDDFRDAVHDAGGLQIVTGAGQRVWRPLDNPPTLQVSAFLDESPQGFGLTQRRRRFGDYGDTEARYERRPSVWVEPVGNWGKGAVVLVEIPVDTEFNDNIAAFWRPEQPLAAGESMSWSYRLHFCSQPPDTAPLARVADTRTGKAPNSTLRLFVIDFDPADPEAEGVLEIDASASAGELVRTRLERLPENGRRRVTLEFDAGAADLAELSVRLTQNGEARSETWLHRWLR